MPRSALDTMRPLFPKEPESERYRRDFTLYGDQNRQEYREDAARSIARLIEAEQSGALSSGQPDCNKNRPEKDQELKAGDFLIVKRTGKKHKIRAVVKWSQNRGIEYHTTDGLNFDEREVEPG